MQKRWNDIVALLTANGLSMIGNSLSAIAIPWFVYELTGNGLMTAGVVMAGQIPNLIVGLIGGRLIDKVGAKNISLISDAVNFLAILSIPILFTLNALDVYLLAILVFLSQVVDVPGYSARSVMVPAIIDRNRLPRERVNGLNSLIETGADLIGPVIASALLLLTSALYLLVIDSITFLCSFLIVLFLMRRAPDPNTEKDIADPKSAEKGTTEKETSETVSLRNSLRWLSKDRIVLKLALFDSVINMAATPLLALTLPILAKTQTDNAAWLGFWLVCFASGTTLTTFAYTWLGHRLSNLMMLKITPMGQALGLLICCVTLLWGGSYYWIGFGLFIFGVNLGVGSMVDAMVLQTRVPDEQRGTLFSVFETIRYVGVPIGLLVTGFIIEKQNFAMLLATYVCFVLIAGAMWWPVKSRAF